MSGLPLIPAPRDFVPGSGSVDASRLTLTEAQLPALGFQPQHQPDEAYELVVGPEGARLTALTPSGLALGRTSWRALQAAGTVPAGTLRDEPRFGWRGLMLDVSRHFYPVADVKTWLDKLADLKMNRFHWHLVDDQGWRLEIPGYPRFTEVGAWRPGADGRPYGGFYTGADVAEVVAYAAARGITVVPEIELPGHSLAALACYPELGCPGHSDQVSTEWGIFDGIYCAGSETAFVILEAVLDTVCRLFPGPWVHVGGDEVVRTRWQTCPLCQAKIAREGLDGEAGLEAAFFHRVFAWLAAWGKTALGWNEMAEHRPPVDLPVQWWHRPDLALGSLKAGNPLISSNVEYCYFDYPYRETDPWYQRSFMLVTPVEQVYRNPVVPPGAEAYASQVLGAEACLWTERVPPAEAVNRLRGRLEALAEVVWTFDRRPGWASFEARARARNLL